MDEKLAKIGTLITSSFIGPLTENNDITDISYNGKDIYYLDTRKGRTKYKREISSEEVYDLLRQISNLCDKQFSISNPLLDVSFLNFRLNAVYKNICRKTGEKVLTFCLRKFDINKIKVESDYDFMSEDIRKFLRFAIKNKYSMLIGGPTSSGKTELQKFLINSFKNNERLIVVDTINELDINYNPYVDVTCLVADDMQDIGLKKLIKLALRYNPDYVILAEARGAEFEDVLTSSLSGISTITTLHCKNIDTIVNRAINLVQINNKNLSYKIIEQMILFHFDLFIYVTRRETENGEVKRQIQAINLVENGKIVELCRDFENKIHIERMPETIRKQYLRYVKMEE